MKRALCLLVLMYLIGCADRKADTAAASPAMSYLEASKRVEVKEQDYRTALQLCRDAKDARDLSSRPTDWDSTIDKALQLVAIESELLAKAKAQRDAIR